MTPQEKREFEELKTLVQTLLRVESVPFIESIKRRLDIKGEVSRGISLASLGDLSDVDIPTPSDGQVLKYTTTGDDRWIAGADNVA